MTIQQLHKLREELSKQCMDVDDINLVINSIITIYGQEEK